MKQRPLRPFIPIERHETIRRKIISLLERDTLSAKDISVEIGISEKEAYDHLEHIQRTINKSCQTFIVEPAACKRCGFVFKKREKLKKPGRCPVCKSESVRDPLFAIENK